MDSFHWDIGIGSGVCFVGGKRRDWPASDEEAQGVQVALESGPQRRRHAVVVAAVAVLARRLLQQVQVAVSGRSEFRFDFTTKKKEKKRKENPSTL